MKKLDSVVTLLLYEKPLPIALKNHALTGKLAGCKECHIEPDWLLVYHIRHKILILDLIRTGTHNDLFNK